MTGSLLTFATAEPTAHGVVESFLASMREQSSTGWELLAVRDEPGLDSASPGEVVRADFRTVPVAATSSLADRMTAAVAAAQGEFIAFLPASGAIAPGAIRAVLDFLAAHPDTDVLYGNEEGIDDGVPFLKPVFSPERLRGQDYLGPFTLYRVALLERIGGVRSGFVGAERHDLALRATAAAGQVRRVESVLFRSAPLPALSAEALASTRRALEEHLDATGGGTVVSASPDGVHITRRVVHGEPLVSIIIPTRGDSALIQGERRLLVLAAIHGILERSTYSKIEFVIVLDDSSPEGLAEELRALLGDRLLIVPWSAPFSFSGKMNSGVLASRGEYLLFLNDDVEVISPDWIEAMLALAQLPDAGIAGSMLYFEDDTIQHAGHAYYRSDVTHIGLNSERGARGPHGAFLLEREVDGATAACAVMPRQVFMDAGGFTTLLPGNFNDVDLCMKIGVLGRRAYWTPHAELYHFESKSRDPRVALYEIETAWGRWENLFWESKYWPDDPHQVYRAE